MSFSDYPWGGGRAAMDEHGVVERLETDAAVAFWVCCLVAEPWTWRVLPDQHVARCCDCGEAVIYRQGPVAPAADARVQKICWRCADRRRAEDADA